MTQRLGKSWKPLTPGGSLDDLDCPRSTVGQRVSKLFAAIDPIGKNILEPWEAISQVLQQGNSAMNILNVRRVDMGR